MLEKEDNYQLELFSQSKDYSERRNLTRNSHFLTFIWNYEKTILIIIGIVITGIISFSLGVDKGRRLSSSNNNSRFDFALMRPVTAPAGSIKEEPKVKEYIAVYTIQLASYRTKTSAQKEAETLKKKGLPPLILSKGGYAVLCVGSFSNKDAAQSTLSELKKRYQDCYIRRL
jgi:hypothetical protein